MEKAKDIIWIILISAWATTAQKNVLNGGRVGKNDEIFTFESVCTAREGILLRIVRLIKDTCVRDLNYKNKAERKILLDIKRKCNGKSRCEMVGFDLPTINILCDEITGAADDLDFYYWCLPSNYLGGDNVHNIGSNLNESITKVGDTPHYFIYNNTVSELQHVVCNIIGLSAGMKVKLLYVDWEPECERLKENISINYITYGCKNFTADYEELTFHTNAVQLEIFKQSRLIWIQFESEKPRDIKCNVNPISKYIDKSTSTTSSYETESDNRRYSLLYIVIPVSTLTLIIVITILILYRMGIICKNQRFKRIDTETDVPITSDENGEYTTINEAASSAPKASYDKVAYYAVDTQSLLLKQQRHDESKLEHQTSPTTASRLRDNHYDEAEIETTYATVNKNPLSKTVKVNVEQSRSTDEVEIQQNDNVYARLQHLQDSSKITENVYNG